VQITAEQILREAAERQEQPTDKKPRQNITDPEELEEFKYVSSIDIDYFDDCACFGVFVVERFVNKRSFFFFFFLLAR
jgi:hypothetical protein